MVLAVLPSLSYPPLPEACLFLAFLLEELIQREVDTVLEVPSSLYVLLPVSS